MHRIPEIQRFRLTSFECYYDINLEVGYHFIDSFCQCDKPIRYISKTRSLFIFLTCNIYCAYDKNTRVITSMQLAHVNQLLSSV